MWKELWNLTKMVIVGVASSLISSKIIEDLQKRKEEKKKKKDEQG